MPFPGNIAATRIVLRAIVTASTVIAANVAPLVVLHYIDKDSDKKAYEQRIKDQSNKPIR